jgi:hypothetical protein
MTMQEAGKAAGTFMTILKGQPLSLALVVMNLALLLLVFYNANQVQAARSQLGTLIIKTFSDTNVLLSKCIDADEVRKLLQVSPPTP